MTFHSHLDGARQSSAPERSGHDGAWFLDQNDAANLKTLTRSELQLGVKAVHGSGFFFTILGNVERLLRCTSGSKNSTYIILARSSCSSFLQFLRRRCGFTSHEDFIEV
jgi:hypothetical protein